jgi:hypothetical protein
MTSPRILYCRCAHARVVPDRVKNEVLERLAGAGVSFEAVADLCEMSARRDPALASLATGDGELRIAACFPRAVRWLFAASGAPLPAADAPGCPKIANMRQETAADVVSTLLDGIVERQDAGTALSEGQTGPEQGEES